MLSSSNGFSHSSNNSNSNRNHTQPNNIQYGTSGTTGYEPHPNEDPSYVDPHLLSQGVNDGYNSNGHNQQFPPQDSPHLASDDVGDLDLRDVDELFWSLPANPSPSPIQPLILGDASVPDMGLPMQQDPAAQHYHRQYGPTPDHNTAMPQTRRGRRTRQPATWSETHAARVQPVSRSRLQQQQHQQRLQQQQRYFAHGIATSTIINHDAQSDTISTANTHTTPLTIDELAHPSYLRSSSNATSRNGDGTRPTSTTDNIDTSQLAGAQDAHNPSGEYGSYNSAENGVHHGQTMERDPTQTAAKIGHYGGRFDDVNFEASRPTIGHNRVSAAFNDHVRNSLSFLDFDSRIVNENTIIGTVSPNHPQGAMNAPRPYPGTAVSDHGHYLVDDRGSIIPPPSLPFQGQSSTGINGALSSDHSNYPLDPTCRPTDAYFGSIASHFDTDHSQNFSIYGTQHHWGHGTPFEMSYSAPGQTIPTVEERELNYTPRPLSMFQLPLMDTEQGEATAQPPVSNVVHPDQCTDVSVSEATGSSAIEPPQRDKGKGKERSWAAKPQRELAPSNALASSSRRRNLPCTQCLPRRIVNFGTMEELRVHIFDKHRSCFFRFSGCNRAFSESGQYTRHVTSIHFDCRASKCPDCGKVFSRKDNLKEHMWSSHTDDDIKDGRKRQIGQRRAKKKKSGTGGDGSEGSANHVASSLSTSQALALAESIEVREREINGAVNGSANSVLQIPAKIQCVPSCGQVVSGGKSALEAFMKHTFGCPHIRAAMAAETPSGGENHSLWPLENITVWPNERESMTFSAWWGSIGILGHNEEPFLHHNDDEDDPVDRA